jgi:hypothetical protein
MRRVVAAIVLVLSVAVRAQDERPAVAEPALAKTFVTLNDVRPYWNFLTPHLPAALANAPPAALDTAWAAWVRAHDAEVRARVVRGDEDSLVNLWLFGTSFTDRPPARPRDVARQGGNATLPEIVERRLEDLLRALTSPGENDRLRWGGEYLRGLGIEVRTAAGRAEARDLLIAGWKRMRAENDGFNRVLQEPNTAVDPLEWMARYAHLYDGRGLSADTSLLTSFAVDQTLEVLAGSGGIRPPIRRVAVVGPGLDFVNKADGHDFYPEQTIQPFALVDSLLRLGLARAGDLTVTTFDVSARVNDHLLAARARARGGAPYPIHLLLGDSDAWRPGLLQYWAGAGQRVGNLMRSAAPPPSSMVRVRAIGVRPEVVASVIPIDLNVVLERPAPLDDPSRFDLLIATDVFIYYDAFEQALAMLNVGRMLRPGGSLLSNQAVQPIPPIGPAVGHDRVVYSDRQFDHMFWYRRQE